MDIIEQYLAAAAEDDTATLVACFMEDGQVTDEGKTYRGRDEIRAWRERLAGAYEYTVEVLGTEQTGDGRYRVRTNVEGNFPGGQVELAYDFRLRGDLISELVIAP